MRSLPDGDLSGNHEMQQLNTGGMGFKLEGVPTRVRRQRW
jgi:hypothetical protein